MVDYAPPATPSGSPTPYYEDEWVTLYHGDCREVTAWLDADVLVTDPPFGSEGRSGYGRSKIGKRTIANDRTTDVRDDALALWGDRAAVVFGHPSLPEPPGEWRFRLVWDKRFPGLGDGPFRWQHENIFIRGAWTNAHRDVSVLSISRGSQSEARDRHPHQKPDALMTRLLGGAPRGIIADPFAGSGSTLVAAKQLGRRAIGVELDEAYCELIVKRLAQDTLFGGVA